MGEIKSVLAIYDVRGKQEYIYRNNHIKEVIGASSIIRDVFKDYLYPAAKLVRDGKDRWDRGHIIEAPEAIYGYDQNAEEAFSVENYLHRMGGNQYLGEVIYDGGGNFLVVYKNREVFVSINKVFTRRLMEKTYTLKVLCTAVENLNFDDYKSDYARLYELHERNQAQESVIYPVNSLPVVQVDPLTSRPLATLRRRAEEKEPEKVSLESAAKYDKYRKEFPEYAKIAGEKVLDNIVTEKGVESLLAVIYIDGNNMRAQVQDCLNGNKSYKDCVTALRRFSKGIQENYVDGRISDIDQMLDEKYKDKQHRKRRTIISAGDEITIICNARDALSTVKTYFQHLPEGCSSCAGIAIFHSHAPYADAYRLAEECCEYGKDWMKENNLTNANFMDFHYCQGGMGVSLKSIRMKELGEEGGSKPWLISGTGVSEEDYYTLNLAEDMADEVFKKLGHSNIKGLLKAAKSSQAELEMELQRINAHLEEPVDFTLGGKLDPKRKRKLIYDMVLVYDLWFKGRG